MTKHRDFKTAVLLGILIVATAAATSLPAQDFDSLPWGKPPADLKSMMPAADWQEVLPDNLEYENLPCTSLLKVQREISGGQRPDWNEDQFVFYDDKLIAVIYKRGIEFEKELLSREEFEEQLLKTLRDRLSADNPLELHLRGYTSSGDPMTYATIELHFIHSELLKAAREDKMQDLRRKVDEYLPQVIEQLELTLPMTGVESGASQKSPE